MSMQFDRFIVGRGVMDEAVEGRKWEEKDEPQQVTSWSIVSASAEPMHCSFGPLSSPRQADQQSAAG
jgi:hypothetical protein